MNKIPTTNIKEPLKDLSLNSLKYYLNCLRDEIAALMALYDYSSLSARKRRKIAQRAFKCYALYEQLYSYYQPLFDEWKRETVRHLIQVSPVFQKYRALGIIRNSSNDI